MAILFAVLSFVFARQIGRALGYALGMAIAGGAMVAAAPFLLLPGAFRRWKARRARRRSALVERQKAAAGVMTAPQGLTEALEAPQRPKAPVIPLNPRKRP